MSERLTGDNQKIAAQFINGALWAEIKRCLLSRRPPVADVKDDIHIAAAKGHVRSGYEAAIEEVEKMPFEQDTAPESAFARPAVSITAD